MKSFLTFLFLGAFITFGQTPMAAIELTDMNVLYRGYASKIVVGVTNNKKSTVSLQCDNCDTLYQIGDNEYAIIPGTEKRTTVHVILTHKKKSDTIKSMEYKVMTPPDPILFWGVAKDGEKAARASRVLMAKYTPEIPLTARFYIKKWTVIYDGNSASGKGVNLSAAGPLIQTVKPGNWVIIKAVVIGVDGLERNIVGAFNL